jgi:hypothetical protein
VLLQTQPYRTLTVGFALRDNAEAPVEPQRQACLHGHRGLGALTRIPIADFQAQGEGPGATAPEAQDDLLAVWAAIFAIAMGRTWSQWGGVLLCLLRATLWKTGIDPIEPQRRRILVQPGGRNGVEGEGLEGEGTQHVVEVGGKHGIEDVAEAIIVERFPP